MEVALPLSELHFHLLSATKEVGKLLQSNRYGFRVGALLPTLEVGVAGDIRFIMLSPHNVEVSMKLETLWVRNEELLTPASQRLPTTVGVVTVVLRTGAL